jgi:excinuclease ABC subunit A
MHFLPDVWVECTTCRGKRFNHETLQVKYKEKTISDVLEMSISEALELFTGFSKIAGVLGILCEMGLGYLKLGQSAPTLSGGEAQRIKLAAELAKPQSGKTLYLLDEPTTGLHFDDIVKLLKVINGLVDKGNTAVVIEHNLDVIKSADWVIDLGPEAGAGGGFIVAEGTPEDIVKYSQGKPDLRSYTGEMLAPVLKASTREKRQSLDMKQYLKDGNPHEELRQLTKDVKAPWEADGRKWHTVDRRSHSGKTCRWDGEILSWFLDEMGTYELLAEPNFNHRSIVEVKHITKQGSWFLHALTGDEWILTLNFRVPKRTMTPKKLENIFQLQPLDQINEIPRYSGETRTRLENQRGPLQEISLKFYKKDEVTQQQVQEFLKAIVPSFMNYVDGMVEEH